MPTTEYDKKLNSLKETVEDLKVNQKLIMSCLTSDLGNSIKDKDLKVVRWAYSQRFKMLQRDIHRLNQQNKK